MLWVDCRRAMKSGPNCSVATLTPVCLQESSGRPLKISCALALKLTPSELLHQPYEQRKHSKWRKHIINRNITVFDVQLEDLDLPAWVLRRFWSDPDSVLELPPAGRVWCHVLPRSDVDTLLNSIGADG